MRVIGNQAFCRTDPRDFIGHVFVSEIRHLKATGRNFEPGESAEFFRRKNTGKKITFPRIEQRIFGQGSGGHHPGDIPFDQSLRQLGIFHLLTDRRSITGSNQFLQVAIKLMIRKPRHGNRIDRPLITAGQR